jgi:hypothetical protein
MEAERREKYNLTDLVLLREKRPQSNGLVVEEIVVTQSEGRTGPINWQTLSISLPAFFADPAHPQTPIHK